MSGEKKTVKFIKSVSPYTVDEVVTFTKSKADSFIKNKFAVEVKSTDDSTKRNRRKMLEPGMRDGSYVTK